MAYHHALMPFLANTITRGGRLTWASLCSAMGLSQALYIAHCLCRLGIQGLARPYFQSWRNLSVRDPLHLHWNWTKILEKLEVESITLFSFIFILSFPWIFVFHIWPVITQVLSLLDALPLPPRTVVSIKSWVRSCNILFSTPIGLNKLMGIIS